ncbi:2-hydroxyacid dehydrogenase [Chenggangzhangella methanolivorans]|uniref:2-hydroxyacid dehydrogenase n=1 Tax=Chenggangzhangella methanolivorans TaxID=1437009 RepID=UPI00360DDCB4
MSDAARREPLLVLGELMGNSERDLGRRFELLRPGADGPDALLAERGAEIRGIVTRGRLPINAALMDRLPKLEIVSGFGVGYDSVDVAEAARRGIVVTNTPDVLTDEVADFTVGLTLATIREIPQSDVYLRSGGWNGGPFRLTATLRDRTIGIAGMGRIGQAVAKRLEPFGRPIAYHSRRPVEGLGYRHFPDLLGLAQACDVLIVILPGGAATNKAVNAEVLKALGPNGVLINVARGSVVDEAALVDALTSGGILAAGLDVFEREPAYMPELGRLANVVLTPHVGSGTHWTRERMADLTVANLETWFDGKGPVTPVPETPWTAQSA